MSYGPVVANFTPLGQIADSFFNARDKAIDRQWKQAQLTAPGDIASIIAQNSGQGSATPPANVQPGMTPLGSIGQNYNPQGRAPAFATMDGTQPTAQFGGDKEAFARSVMPYAIQASQQTGVDPRIIVAQAALESGWGQHAPGNNFFGIKGQGQSLATTEVVNGQPVKVTDSFRTFGSPADSFNGYANFINSNPRYQGLKTATGLDSQIAALAASGYATDPQYGQKIAAIAKSLPAPGGTQTVANPFQTAQASPADEPAPGAQPAQFVIPGSGQAVPAASGGVTAPNIPVPPYIKALAASTNPYVRAKATELYLQYQQQQQQYALKAWELNAQAALERGKPMKVGPEQDIINPATGEVIRKGHQNPITVGNTLVDPNTYEPVFTAPRNPIAVGNALVRPDDGSVVYQGPEKPETLSPGQSMVGRDGKVIYTAPGRPQAVAPGSTLVGDNGQPVYTAPEKPQVVGNSLVRSDGTVAYQGPKTKTEMVNGRLVFVDENGGTAKDITPQGLPAGYRPMTPEERQQFQVPDNTGAYIGPDGKPAAMPGTANTTVKLPPQENAYDSGQGKDYSDTFTGLQKSARAAMGTKNTLALMDRLTRDPNFYSGFGGEGKLKMNQLLTSLGVKDANAAAPSEVFRGLVNDVILGKLGGSLGTGVSNGDVQFMQNTAPNLTNTKEGNQLLIQFAGRMADRQQQIGQMARDYAKQHGGRIDLGFDDQLSKWAQDNPLFTEKDFQAAKDAANGVPADAAPKPVRERPLPPAKEWVPLPQGYTAAKFITDAKAALAKGKAREAIEEELWKRGIDPKTLDK